MDRGDSGQHPTTQPGFFTPSTQPAGVMTWPFSAPKRDATEVAPDQGGGTVVQPVIIAPTGIGGGGNGG